jgi:arylsulfatase A-like enzyme
MTGITFWNRGGAQGRDGRDEEVEGDRIASGPGDVLLLALWLGMVVGLAEVGCLVAVRWLTATITYETLRTNWHYAWMIPVSYVTLFGAFGLALALAGWARPRWCGFRLAAYVLGYLAVQALILAIPRIHGVALIVLAFGVTTQVGRWLAAHSRGVSLVVRRTLVPLAFAVAVLVVWRWVAVSGTERRALASLPRAVPAAPNVLLIVLDTVRADGVFPQSDMRDPTPFLTRLARRGVRFDEARSTAPWTLPSHASLFTGRWPHELSVKVGRPLDDTHATLAEHLAGRGYATAAFMGNTHNGNAWYGLDRGFSRYVDHYENTQATPLELLRSSRMGTAFLMSKLGQRAIKLVMTPPSYMYRKTAAMVGRDALAWLDQNTGRPFFAVLNYYDAHDPYEPPPGAPRPYSSRPSERPRNDFETARDAYDDCLAYLDAELERLFDELQRRGILKNTLVVLTSDHGEGFGEHDLTGHGISLYRQELHVPLLVILPSGVAGGRVIREPVSLRDVASTIIDVTDTEADSPFPGVSLAWSWSEKGETSSRDPVLSEVDGATNLEPSIAHAPTGRGDVKSIVAEGHVYIRNGDGGEELYDLRGDRHEADNQADDPGHSPTLGHFRGLLDRLLEQERSETTASDTGGG